MKLEFGAVGICVKDIKTMVKFYRDVVGLDIQWEAGLFAGTKMSNGFFFNLYQGEQQTIVDMVNTTFQLSCATQVGEEFTPDDVDREYERIIRAGARPIIPPRNEPYGMRIAYVADPEGNQIEICCPLED